MSANGNRARRGLQAVAVVLLTLCAAGCLGTHNRPIQLISGAGPVYPVEARASGIEGDVVVRYDVASDGRVINARVDSATPPGVFDEAALTAVRAWRYNPKIVDGVPQTVRNILSTVRFRLDDGDVYDAY